MDLQNVKNITIPEGSVKTIHDEDDRLLWGAVGYDTKYAGDTLQQTYSGKNLFDGTGWRAVSTSQGYPSPSGSGSVIVDSGMNNIKFDAPATYTGAESGFIPVTSGLGYVVSFDIKKTCNRLFITQYDSSKTRVSVLRTVTSVGTTTFTASQDGYVTVAFANTTVDSGFEFDDIQLELGSTPTSYEPFVGGTASPNPDYPQNIDVVTGEQTVTVSDGVNSQDYTVDLGSIELCKISTYQDYIYKSGDDWYVHKAIGKNIADGNTSWTKSPYGTNNYSFVPSPHSVAGENIPNKILVLSNCCTGVTYDDRTIAMNNIAYVTQQNIFIRNSPFDTVSELTTFCSTNSPVFYYVLATATDTKITDATLISQLNTIHEWLTRYGYNATVTGNLPMIINQTNL